MLQIVIALGITSILLFPQHLKRTFPSHVHVGGDILCILSYAVSTSPSKFLQDSKRTHAKVSNGTPLNFLFPSTSSHNCGSKLTSAHALTISLQ